MARITRMTRKRLGDVLIEQGLLDEDSVKKALREQRRTGELLGEVMVRLGFVTEADIAGAIVTQFAIPFIRLEDFKIEQKVFDIFPSAMYRQYQFVPMDHMGEVVTIALSGLLSEDVMAELEKTASARILPFITTQSDITTTLHQFCPEAEAAEPQRARAGSATAAIAAAETADEVKAAVEPAEAPDAEEDVSEKESAALAQKAVEDMAAQSAGDEGAEALLEGVEGMEKLSSLGSMLLSDDE